MTKFGFMDPTSWFATKEEPLWLETAAERSTEYFVSIDMFFGCSLVWRCCLYLWYWPGVVVVVVWLWCGCSLVCEYSVSMTKYLVKEISLTVRNFL